MKKDIRIIENCRDCSNSTVWSRASQFIWLCSKNKWLFLIARTQRSFPRDPYSIPDWCPLEDAL